MFMDEYRVLMMSGFEPAESNKRVKGVSIERAVTGLLCSRNARPQKDLVRRAQWETDDGPLFCGRVVRASLERVSAKRRAVGFGLALPLISLMEKGIPQRRLLIGNLCPH